MKAVRLRECLDRNPREIGTDFEHIEHMYTGRLSRYYYARFDQALEKAKLSEEDRVLILGGGTGVFALSVAPLVKNVQFTDIPRETPPFSTPKKIFEYSNIDDSNVEFVPADATNLQYRSGTFDVVFALDVLEHIPDERAAVREIGRVTKEEGRAVVSAPVEVGVPELIRETYRFIDGNRRQTESLTELLQNVFGSPTISEPGNHRGYDYRVTIELLEKAFGWTSVEYCPFPRAKWLNPTALITSSHSSL